MRVLDEHGLAYFWETARQWLEQRMAARLPKGLIAMWSGSKIPDGWALCDGQNGTPDLRGRFVLGQSEGHPMGETGGAEEVTLTVAQMPRHAHLVFTSSKEDPYGKQRYFSEGALIQSSEYQDYKLTPNDPLITNYMSVNGSSNPHPNMPPYYALAYIMKL